MVIRERYLKKIRPFYDKDLIKVIIGMRRCGKSILLRQIQDELIKSGIREEQIIDINFEFKKNSFIKNDDDLYVYIKEKIVNKDKYYIFLDEIQKIKEWEKTVTGIKAEYDVSIFITGSNSNLLSSEIATLLAGRYVSFKVLPFCFEEVCNYLKIENNEEEIEKAFSEYILWGGLPQKFILEDEEQVKTYLSDIYDSVVVKDIIDRFQIKDIELLNKIVEYLVTNPSQNFSADNMVNYFSNNDNRNVSKETVYNYLEYMEKAIIINKVNRYDVRGKRILSGKYKYYLTDMGIGQIRNIGKRVQLGAYCENIVFNELISRGYSVNIGNINQGKIDFIATRFDEKIYIQVCYIIADDSVQEREFGAFKQIQDNYPKYVLSLDKFDFSQEGIIHKNLIKWLLEEDKK